MRTRTAATLLLSSAALIACTDTTSTSPSTTPTDVATPSFSIITLDPVTEEILAEAGIEVLQPNDNDDAATGGVRYVLDKTFPAQLAFSAIRRVGADKQVTVLGQYEYREDDVKGSTRIHGDVACLEVTANTATFGGPIKHIESDVNVPGGWVIFHVVDNGEPNALGILGPDMATRAITGVDPKIGCRTKLLGAEPTTEGNIQVHNGDGL